MSAQTVIDNIAERVALEGERVRAELQAGLKETRNAVAVRGARLGPLYGSAGLASNATSGRLVGWSVRETTGTAGAVLTVYSGHDSAGDVLAVIVLDPGKGQTIGLPGAGVSYEDGAYFAVAAAPGAGSPGTVVGSLYFGAVD